METFKNAISFAIMLIITTGTDAGYWISPYAYCYNNPVGFVDLKDKRSCL